MKIVEAMMKVECPNLTFKTCHGGSGETGMLAWMKGTYQAASKQMTGEVLPFTEVNEKYVGALTVQRLLDEGKGKDAEEIGRIWNTSLLGAEEPRIVKGVNKYNVPFDSLAHGLKVKRAFANQ